MADGMMREEKRILEKIEEIVTSFGLDNWLWLRMVVKVATVRASVEGREKTEMSELWIRSAVGLQGRWYLTINSLHILTNSHSCGNVT